jgi:pyridoxamine 5'-phosphate oxidase
MNDISGIRQDYNISSLDINEIAENPFDQFKNWFNGTLKSEQFYDPTAFTLSTCGNDRIPHSRIVLL